MRKFLLVHVYPTQHQGMEIRCSCCITHVLSLSRTHRHFAVTVVTVVNHRKIGFRGYR